MRLETVSALRYTGEGSTWCGKGRGLQQRMEASTRVGRKVREVPARGEGTTTHTGHVCGLHPFAGYIGMDGGR